MLDRNQECPDCGRDFAGDPDPDVEPGMPCPSDDCPSMTDVVGEIR